MLHSQIANFLIMQMHSPIHLITTVKIQNIDKNLLAMVFANSANTMKTLHAIILTRYEIVKCD
jgi:hypothetical protein